LIGAAEMKQRRILIVEDETVTAKYIRNILEGRGYAVADVVGSGNEALDCFAAEQIDLVIMDIILDGEMDGIEVAHRIKAQRDVPIIYLTASTDERNLSRAMETGPHGYLIKPIDEYELFSIVETILFRDTLEKKLRESEEKYRTLVENINDVLLIVDTKGMVTYISPVIMRMSEYAVDEIVGRNFTEFIHPDDIPALLESFTSALEGELEVAELRILGKDGTARYVRTSSRPIEKDCIVVGLSSIMTDITENKRLEQEKDAILKNLRERTKELGCLYSISKIVEKRDLALNAILKEVTKTIPEAWQYPDIAQARIVYDGREYRPRNFTKPARAITSDIIVRGEKAGHVEVSYRENRPLRDEERALLDVIAEHLGTIIEQKRADEDLSAANRRIESLITSITSILIQVSTKDRIMHWNEAAERTFGIKSSEVIDRQFSECPINWEWERIYEGISQCIIEGRPIRLDEITFKRSDGKERFLGITVNPVKDDGNTLTGFLLFGADITEKKLLESQLLQAQKLESIGQLAAGIAHEINTPTQYVNDNTHFLRDAFSDLKSLHERFERLVHAVKETGLLDDVIDEIEITRKEIDFDYISEEIPKAIDQSLEGLDRISRIVKSMKQFSHPGTEHKTVEDINRALENTLTISRNEWKYVADIETDYDESLPPVSCFPAELNQVFLNIVVNAAQAIEESYGGNERKGLIQVSTRMVNKHAEVRISDNGKGIPPEIQSKVFDPFFTTKAVGKGTGQGLAISHAVIVEKHSGTISLESEVGKGTTFIIRLPLEG
jgi:PAS domain S-box-containing protein